MCVHNFHKNPILCILRSTFYSYTFLNHPVSIEHKVSHIRRRNIMCPFYNSYQEFYIEWYFSQVHLLMCWNYRWRGYENIFLVNQDMVKWLVLRFLTIISVNRYRLNDSYSNLNHFHVRNVYFSLKKTVWLMNIFLKN